MIIFLLIWSFGINSRSWGDIIQNNQSYLHICLHLTALLMREISITTTSHERHKVSHYVSFDCLLNSLCGPVSPKYQGPHYWPTVMGNSAVTDEFTAQKASNAEKASIWWRHHAFYMGNVILLYLEDICSHGHTSSQPDDNLSFSDEQ